MPVTVLGKLLSSTERKTPRWIAQHGNARRNMPDNYAARRDRHPVADHGTLGDNAIGMYGNEIPNSGATGNRAMAVDLTPVSDLRIVADHGVFLYAGEFADMRIH
jgi:hypothetical protein